MNTEKYKVLLSIFNQLNIEKYEEKVTKFKKIVELMISDSDIVDTDIDLFLNIYIVMNDGLYDRLIDEEVEIEIMFYTLTKYCLAIFEEKTAYDVIESILPIFVDYVNNNDDYTDVYDSEHDLALMEIMKLKSLSTDKEIATPASLKLIKYKRENIRGNNDDDEIDESEAYRQKMNNQLYQTLLGLATNTKYRY